MAAAMFTVSRLCVPMYFSGLGSVLMMVLRIALRLDRGIDDTSMSSPQDAPRGFGGATGDAGARCRTFPANACIAGESARRQAQA